MWNHRLDFGFRGLGVYSWPVDFLGGLWIFLVGLSLSYLSCASNVRVGFICSIYYCVGFLGLAIQECLQKSDSIDKGTPI